MHKLLKRFWFPFLLVILAITEVSALSCAPVAYPECPNGVVKWDYSTACGRPYCEENQPVVCPIYDLAECKSGWRYKPDGRGCQVPYCPDQTPSGCPDVYEPYCGRKSVQCFRAPCPQPQPQTYSNSCELKKDGAIALYRGECKQFPVCPEVSPPPCEGGILRRGTDQRGCKKVWCEIKNPPICPVYSLAPCNGTYKYRKDKNGCDVPYCVEDTPQYCPRNYAPVCGKPPIVCAKAPCPQSDPRTYANTCELKRAKATLIHTGACNDHDNDPTVCYEIYKPVCAIDSRPNVEGIPTTFSNDCKAKAAGMTILYQGQCKKPDWPSGCTLEYKPQCGRMPDGNLRTYSNPCLMDKAGATLVHQGKCGTKCNQYSGPVCARSTEIHHGLGRAITYKNECAMVEANAKKLYNGQCKNPDQQNLPSQFPNCKRFFDGCNTCVKMDNGSVICTQRACLESQKRPARCLDQNSCLSATELREKFPGCRRLYDGCNACTVGYNGQMVCTRRACKTCQEPRCLDTIDRTNQTVRQYDQYRRTTQNRPATTTPRRYTRRVSNSNNNQSTTYRMNTKLRSWRDYIRRWRAR